MAAKPFCIVFLLLAAGVLALVDLWHGAAIAQSDEDNMDYEHDRYAPDETDIQRTFAAFVVSFDSKDDDDGDGDPDLRRIPEWVAQEIRSYEGECVNTLRRPSRWSTDRSLYASGIAPNDASYAGSGFDRGHMAAKLLAARIGLDADRETHTVLNAVPQIRQFKQQIWHDLEDHTGAWAQAFGKIWVIQGPVFYEETQPENSRWIGDAKKGERPVAVPDALFKIVVREDESVVGGLQALAFLYPQLGARYYGRKEQFAHERFLTTISEIEGLTGLSFSKLKSQRYFLELDLWEADNDDYITDCTVSD